MKRVWNRREANGRNPRGVDAAAHDGRHNATIQPVVQRPGSGFGERGDERIDLLLVGPFAPGVDTRAQGIADPEYDLVGPWRVMDQDRCGIEGVEVPALIERPVEQVDGSARGPNLGVAWNYDPTAPDGAAHGHTEPRMDHGGAMLKIAAHAYERGLRIGAHLCRAAAKGGKRDLGERDAEFEGAVDERSEVGTGAFAGKGVLEYGAGRHTPQRGIGARAIFGVDVFDNRDGLAHVHGRLLGLDWELSVSAFAEIAAWSGARTAGQALARRGV